MSTVNISFAGAIRAAATALDRVPTPEQVGDLEIALQSLAHIDPQTSIVTIASDAGPVPVDAYLAAEALKFSRATNSSVPPNSTSSAPGQTQADRDADLGVLRIGSSVQHGRPRGDGFADIARALQAQHDTALGAAAANWPNPWLAGQINRTRQVVLQKLDPAKAAKFKTEAAS